MRGISASRGGETADVEPFYKQYRCILGFVAQTCYVCVLCFLSLHLRSRLVVSVLNDARVHSTAVRRWASTR